MNTPNELTVEYFWCHQCGFFLAPYDGDAALAHIQKHQAEKGKTDAP